MMRVRDGEDFLELRVVDRCATVYAVGDAQFDVRVRIHGFNAVFTAESRCWVEWTALQSFAEQLHLLDQDRQGSAVLESMSPGELRLEIRTIDQAGHTAAVGEVGRWLGAGVDEPYWSAVAFRVPFCPSELPALAREFRRLVDHPDATTMD